MTFEELQAVVARGESEEIEFKRSTVQRTEAAKTVCAMLNGRSGFVLFGVTNKDVRKAHNGAQWRMRLYAPFP